MTDLHDPDYFLELQTQTGWGTILRSFASWLDPKPATLILDVGTGPGLLPAIFAQSGCCALGIDSSFDIFNNALHPNLILAAAQFLPFKSTNRRAEPVEAFNLITATNLLFLLSNPLSALKEMTRLLAPNGEIAIINPSEKMTISAATALADERNLTGLARKSLLNYAARAERHHCWSEEDLRALFASSNLELTETTTKMGNGLVRFVKGQLR